MIVSHCKACNAEIYWVTIAAGKTMPLDVRSYTLFVLEPEGAQDGSPRARAVQARASHFSTCPRADEFRRQGR